jgi:hypothetical protein
MVPHDGLKRIDRESTMFGKPKASRGKPLKGYEATNVLFLIFFVSAMALFVSWVFVTFRSPNRLPEPEDRAVILEEIVAPDGDSCVFHVGTNVTNGSRAYRSPLDIPVTDDGFVRSLFQAGIAEVNLEPRIVMLRKYPNGNWGALQPKAREIITNHLHLHP